MNIVWLKSPKDREQFDKHDMAGKDERENDGDREYCHLNAEIL